MPTKVRDITFKNFISHTNLSIGEYAVFTAYVNPGDEVIMFEPFFDQYLASVTFHGGIPVYVPLHPPSHDQKAPTGDDWTIDFEELR